MPSHSEAIVLVETSIVVGAVIVAITLMWGHCTVAIEVPVVGVRVACGHVTVVLVEVLVGIGACGMWHG